MASRPTESQIQWLAGIFGREIWEELNDQPEFVEALETSIELARRVGLRYLAEKEVTRRAVRHD